MEKETANKKFCDGLFKDLDEMVDGELAESTKESDKSESISEDKRNTMVQGKYIFDKVLIISEKKKYNCNEIIKE